MLREEEAKLSDSDIEVFVSEVEVKSVFNGTAVMSRIKKTHWYSAVDNTVRESEDRESRAWNKNKKRIQRWRQQQHTIRMLGYLLYCLFVFKSSKTTGLLNSETAVMSLIYIV